MESFWRASGVEIGPFLFRGKLEMSNLEMSELEMPPQKLSFLGPETSICWVRASFYAPASNGHESNTPLLKAATGKKLVEVSAHMPISTKSTINTRKTRQSENPTNIYKQNTQLLTRKI